MTDRLVCTHGQLTRSCEICDRDATIADLRAEVERLRALIDDYIPDRCKPPAPEGQR